LPARYVIDSRSIIRAADVNADYTIRPEASETLRFLKELVSSKSGPGVAQKGSAKGGS
jgi:hypothetical protein